MRERKGFTLVELLVVVSIIALLISILLPTLSRAKEITKQMICSTHLSGIGKAWALYQSENNDMPPILPDVDQDNDHYRQPLRLSSECDRAHLGAGAQQNLCLLVKGHYLSWGMFLCPSTGNQELDRSQNENWRYGLGGTVDGQAKIFCDYAIQIPYSHKGDNLCPLTSNMDGGIAILGDKGPDGNYSTEWSPNHPKDGESLLYAGGNVRFSRDKNEAGDKNTGGWGGNNVYTKDEWEPDPDDPEGNPDPVNPVLKSIGDSVDYPASTKDSVLWTWRP